VKNKLIILLKRETDINLPELFFGFAVIGITNALVLVIVHNVAQSGSRINATSRLLAMFVLCVAAFTFTKRFINARLTRHVQQAISQLRVRILEKLRNTSLLSFERLDRSQVINAVSENTLVIVDGARHFGQGVPAAIMLLCSFVYIATISMFATYMVIICVVICAVVVSRLNRSIAVDLNQSIRKEDEFLGSFHQLLGGFKELKMSRAMSEDLFENHLRKSSLQAKVLNTRTATSIEDSDVFTYVFFYVLLGSILFLLPRLNKMTAPETVAITTILLFLLGNGTVFVQALPNITKTDVAIGNITRLEQLLDEVEEHGELSDVSPWPPDANGSIEVHDLSFTYPATKEQSFTVHVDALQVEPGELLFLQGGNGSGKSTLLKVLVGLYRPTAGTMTFNRLPVTDANVHHYRELFGIIFTDFHLFDRLYGMEEVDAARAAALLDEVQLSDKTGYAEGKFLNLDLSTGQRKRLALVAALLRDRPLYAFDEVVADQDPEFRRYFYEVMLRNLKKQGKTIIAATHDDRYFHVADRVLKMEYGRIVDEKKRRRRSKGAKA